MSEMPENKKKLIKEILNSYMPAHHHRKLKKDSSKS
jgi:hypothetical protein